MYSNFDFCEHEPKCRRIKRNVKKCSQLQPVREIVLVLYFSGAHAAKESLKVIFNFCEGEPKCRLGTILLPGGEKIPSRKFRKISRFPRVMLMEIWT